MIKMTKYSRHTKMLSLKISAIVILISFFLLPNFIMVESTGDNVVDLVLNGEVVGTIPDLSKAEDLVWQARRELATEMDDILFTESKLEYDTREEYFVQFTPQREVVDAMKEALKKEATKALSPAYTIKVNQVMVTVGSIEEVESVLQTALDKYQRGKEFSVVLGPDAGRELSVLSPTVCNRQEILENEEGNQELMAGVTLALKDMLRDVTANVEPGFEDFEYGLRNIDLVDKVEIVESYLPKDQILSVLDAAALVTQLKEKEIVYEVVAGDTLSEIALKNDIPLDTVIALNENLEDENSTIRVGDKLLMTEPEPELNVTWQEELYYEEDYEAEIQYIYNDDWFTTDSKVVQQPSAGHRKVAALKTYYNEKEVSTEILKEEVTYQAVPKIIEKGTKVPPTYIKPISGGRLSSRFGRRKAPKKGASTYHKGIDWATPVGTKVVASCGGTVAKAGWGSGYGYVVYINHADGRQTRYGHLSKVLVKPGDKVSQGQKIALSGNTGRSTGPHVHFEILINGSQVDPFKYMN